MLQQEKVEEKNKTNKDSGNAFRCLTATSAIYVGGFGYFSNTACHLSLKHTKNKINKAKPISALLLSWYLHHIWGIFSNKALVTFGSSTLPSSSHSIAQSWKNPQPNEIKRLGDDFLPDFLSISGKLVCFKQKEKKMHKKSLYL